MKLIFLKKTFIIGIKIWRLKTTHCQHSNSLIGFGFKKTPCSRCLMVKLYTQFKTQDSEINKAFSGICHRDEIRGVPPPPPTQPPPNFHELNLIHWIKYMKISASESIRNAYFSNIGNGKGNDNQRENHLLVLNYKITKIVRALWLAKSSVCMRVCKHGCGVKMFCFSRTNYTSPNLKKFASSKLVKVTLFTHSFVGWNLENCYKESVSIFFSLKLTF